jgi:hypothetical protein
MTNFPNGLDLFWHEQLIYSHFLLILAISLIIRVFVGTVTVTVTRG